MAKNTILAVPAFHANGTMVTDPTREDALVKAIKKENPDFAKMVGPFVPPKGVAASNTTQGNSRPENTPSVFSQVSPSAYTPDPTPGMLNAQPPSGMTQAERKKGAVPNIGQNDDLKLLPGEKNPDASNAWPTSQANPMKLKGNKR